MPMSAHLSRRERQIMDIVYELSEASAKDIETRLPNPPGYSAIRATMNKLETKGVLAHRERNLKYIYYPLIDHQQASTSALHRLLKTFFEGSASLAMSTLLDISKNDVTLEELDELNILIEKAKKEKE
ncbi:MAG: CopY family transcriptional regulator [SAR86 cluster bacterium]|uniref:CopY family transcriptional regulator n=1 Tax=SAR86 cluster bacterium TaxID=2030880 RepID=A0A2A5B2I4_9GAMM|nr:MAG: CopY family transcriptional regulator [SAR86 cluster bacterium]